MSKRTIVHGALIVLAASLITRILGFVFRVYISNQLGAEGMGLYQLVLSLYMLVVTFATSGISVAVSRMVAEQLEVNKYGSTKTVLRMSVAYSLLISIAAGILLFAFAVPLGNQILKDGRTILSLRCLAPSLPFMAVSACIRGYYFARRDSFKPSSAQVIEQVAKMAFIVAVIGWWLPYGDAFACAATVLGMTVGEIVSCAYVVFTYYAGRKKERGVVTKRWKTLKTILGISVPIQTSSTLHSALRLIENLLIISGLTVFTHGNSSAAIGSYGILKGMVLPLLSFPTSLISALVTTLVPEVAGANAGGKDQTVARAVRRVLQLTLLMSVFIVSVFMLFPEQLGTMFYGEREVGEMLKLLCFICPFMYLEMVTVGILNAVGEQVSPLRYNIIDSVLRIGMIFFFVPKGGIYAFLWIMIGSNLLTSLLNLRRLLKVTSVKLEFFSWIAKPGIAAAAVGLLVKLLCDHWMFAVFPTWLAILVGIGVASVCYILLLFLLGCVTKKDVLWFKDCFHTPKKAK